MSGSPNSLRDLKPGDRVQVFSINGARSGQPKGGWDGTVVKVGRKLVTVQYRTGNHTDVFRMEDGRLNSKDFSTRVHIETVEQAAENLRRSDFIARLRERGVSLDRWSNFTTAKLEALLALMDQDDLEVV